MIVVCTPREVTCSDLAVGMGVDAVKRIRSPNPFETVASPYRVQSWIATIFNCRLPRCQADVAISARSGADQSLELSVGGSGGRSAACPRRCDAERSLADRDKTRPSQAYGEASESVGVGSLNGADQQPILVEELEDLTGDLPAVIDGVGSHRLHNPLQHLVFAENDGWRAVADGIERSPSAIPTRVDPFPLCEKPNWTRRSSGHAAAEIGTITSECDEPAMADEIEPADGKDSGGC